jgi:hypothetical protein
MLWVGVLDNRRLPLGMLALLVAHEGRERELSRASAFESFFPASLSLANRKIKYD